MAGFSELKSEFDAVGTEILAASADDPEMAAEVQVSTSFPVAFGVSRDVADSIGAWWEDRRSIVQPAEFILDSGGKVLSSTYSTGPVGRLDAEDALKFIRFIESQKD